MARGCGFVMGQSENTRPDVGIERPAEIVTAAEEKMFWSTTLGGSNNCSEVVRGMEFSRSTLISTSMVMGIVTSSPAPSSTGCRLLSASMVLTVI